MKQLVAIPIAPESIAVLTSLFERMKPLAIKGRWVLSDTSPIIPGTIPGETIPM